MLSAMGLVWLTLLALCSGALTQEDEIGTLLETDTQLTKQMQEMRRFINGELTRAVEVIDEKTDKNRKEIANLAEMTQKSLAQLRGKVNEQSEELGEVEDVAEVALPTIGAEVAGKLSEDQAEIDQLTERSKSEKTQLKHIELEVKNRSRMSRLQARVKDLEGRLQEMQDIKQAQVYEGRSTKFLGVRMSEMNQTMLDMSTELRTHERRIIIQEILFVALMAMVVLFMALVGQHVLRPLRDSPLKEPLLPSTEHSFSIVTPRKGVQLFMKSTAVFLGTGEVTADQLKPGRRLRGAMGGWLDVEAVTFQKMPAVEIVQLTLEGAPSAVLAARQPVVRAAEDNEVVPACEIREGDWVLFHGGLLKVQRSHFQILNDIEMVEVVFNSLGAIEMRPDADTSQNMLDIV